MTAPIQPNTGTFTETLQSTVTSLEVNVETVQHTVGTWAAATIEKVLATYIQALIVLVLASGELNTTTWQPFAIAAIPAALTAFAASLPQVPVGLSFYLDLVLRSARTFAASFIGLLVAMPVFSLDLAAWKPLAASAVMTALAVVKGGLARRVGFHDTAAVLPKRLDVDLAA